MSGYRRKGTFTLMPDIDPDQFDGAAEKGTRYSDELWSAIRLEWEADPAVSYSKALKIVAGRLNVPVPSKGACLNYAKRNGWTKGGDIARLEDRLVPSKVKTGRPPNFDKEPPQRKSRAKPLAKVQAKPATKPWQQPIAAEIVDAESGTMIGGTFVPDLYLGDLDLPPMEQLFVAEYLTDFIGGRAVLRAGYETKAPSAYAWELLRKPNVSEAVSRGIRLRQQQATITHEMVLAHWWELAKADPREISEYIVHPCRYCHGAEHQYQWTEQEFKRACDVVREYNSTEKGQKRPKAYPMAIGGMGYDLNASPHASCPVCGGRGEGRNYIKDTRYLSPGARLLYAGVEETKDGVKPRLNSQEKALENVARYLGMYKERVEVDVRVTSSKELDEVYASVQDQVREKAAEVIGRGERLRNQMRS